MRPIVHLPVGGCALAEVERQAILAALEQAGWVQCRAAALLQISPRVMHYKINRHRIVDVRLRRLDPRPWLRHKGVDRD